LFGGLHGSAISEPNTLEMLFQTTTRQKVIGLLAAGFAILIANAVVSLWLGARTASFLDDTLADQALKANLSGVLSAAQDAETGQRGFLLTGEESYLEPYQQSLKNLPRHLTELHAIAEKREGLRQPLAQLERLVDERMGFINRSVASMRSGNRDSSLQQLRAGGGKAVMDQLRTLTGDLLAQQEAQIKAGVANVNVSEAWSKYASLGSLALIVALAGVTGMVVMRFVRELEGSQLELLEVNQGLERIVEERAGDIMRANEEIQRFAYIVSHDLRAPLVNIMGFTSELEAVGKMVGRQFETLIDRAPDLVLPETSEAVKSELPEAISFIRASTAKMDRLINAILGLSREGRRVLTPVHVDMTSLVSTIAASVRHQVDEANGEIIVNKLPAITTDKLAIEQVFSNLVENAVKYGHGDRPPRIEISGTAQGAQVSYSVADNGRGIDDKDRERIFELFRRAGKQDRPGEGLGLAFVRAAVRRLGGSILVDSTPGEGTTFRLKFPLKLLPTSRS
jgi:signal transduction histidine kinase